MDTPKIVPINEPEPNGGYREFLLEHVDNIKKQIEDGDINHLFILTDSNKSGIVISMSGLPRNKFEFLYALSVKAPMYYEETHLTGEVNE